MSTNVHERYMRVALDLARRAYGDTSPNPMVGAVLVQRGKVVGTGYHKRAGEPHAEIGAIHDAARRKHSVRGATLYVTLEPCSTFGRTPPCVGSILAHGISTVVVGATDPNPLHAGRGLRMLEQNDVAVITNVLEKDATQLNEAFNHWIVKHTPFVTVKAAMSLDGKLATITGESKWITSSQSRECGMQLRRGSDAILVGVNTIIADDASLTIRPSRSRPIRRIILDTHCRIPPSSKVVTDELSLLTTIVVSEHAPKKCMKKIRDRVNILEAPLCDGRIDLKWLLKTLGQQECTSVLVEGGGEVNASFLAQKLAHRVVFFYAPKIVCGRTAVKAVGGGNVANRESGLPLRNVEWKSLPPDLFMTARLDYDGTRRNVKRN